MQGDGNEKGDYQREGSLVPEESGFQAIKPLFDERYDAEGVAEDREDCAEAHHPDGPVGRVE